MPVLSRQLPIKASAAAFVDGLEAAARSVFVYVLLGTYLGIGALAHDFGFPLAWALLTTLLIWAAPAQVILISALGAGASWLAVAIAVGLSSMRLLPMVVAVMPLLKGPQTRWRELALPAHLTAVSVWVEYLRLLPLEPRERRVPFSNGLGLGLMAVAVAATAAGFFLAARLPQLFTAALLFLTPMSFTVSIAGNSRRLSDRLAFALGLVLGPAFAATHVGLDLMWTGLVGGTAAYAVDRMRRARQ